MIRERKIKFVMAILFVVMSFSVLGLVFLGCGSKEKKGEVIRIPVKVSLEDIMDGEVDNIRFAGETVKVELKDGSIVEVLATKEQMEEAYKGKTKATIRKIKDGRWKIIKLE